MNQRIQELAQQSELYVDLYGRPYPRAMSAEESHAAYKKFAQLIVQECAMKANAVAIDLRNDPDLDARKYVGNSILKALGS
jgi:hypothetical protein